MSEAEKRGYCNFFNGELRGDSDLKDTLPINPSSDDFYKIISKGVILR